MEIKDLIKLFGNLRNALEVLYVAYDLKKASRLIYNEGNNLNSAKRFLKENNLSVEISSLKYIVEKDGNKTCYASYAKPVNLNHKQKGFLYIYIAQSRKVSRLAKICEKGQHETEFGRILGYPKCCIDFYNRNIQDCVKKNLDLLFQVLAETDSPLPYPFLNNFVARFFDASLLSHFPCNFNCRKSLKQAKERLELVKSISPALAEHITRELKSLIIHTGSRGIYKINSFSLENGEIILKNKGLVSLNRTYIGTLIEKSNRIRIVGKKRLILMQDNKILKELRGKSIGAFPFQ